MKTLKSYIAESRSGDLFQTVADCISNPKNISDDDIQKIITTVKKIFGFDLPEDEAKSLADSVVSEFPEMCKK